MADENQDSPPRTDGSATDVHKTLVKTRIGADLLAEMRSSADGVFDVVIELNSDFPGGVRAARQLLFLFFAASQRETPPSFGVVGLADEDTQLSTLGLGFAPDMVDSVTHGPLFGPGDALDIWKSRRTQAYAFGKLTADTINVLADFQMQETKTQLRHALIHKIWLDHKVTAFVYESVRTIKCDAARTAFGSAGKDIVWAVADTGVAGDHPHFAAHSTLILPKGLTHCDFTQAYADAGTAEAGALIDSDGHGTHVSGIIAGETFTVRCAGAPASAPTITQIAIQRQVQTGGQGVQTITDTSRTQVSGLAPLCKVMSLKVLTNGQSGNVSNILAAIGYIQQINDYGRDIKVHGLNMSLGYPFDASWFAAGQSPLCSEVNRLVKCGVVVVVAAGNAGYGRVNTSYGVPEVAALMGTVSDPGNADLAITVGSTHRDRPHVYGVSYFSAKGPTADGRMKPDIVAPGERIVSCSIATGAAGVANFKEDSGTSMAAPHVSAAIAAFLSVRAEFIGRPEAIKDIFTRSAMDLNRRTEFQGAGLIDLMKALQTV